jgi:hypothetical protein
VNGDLLSHRMRDVYRRLHLFVGKGLLRAHIFKAADGTIHFDHIGPGGNLAAPIIV